MLPVESPFKTFTGLDGKPLNNGYVYFGLPDQNPITAPVTVYWDVEGTIPAAQPLRTMNGYIVRAGTPANVFIDGSYSEVVKDSKKRQVFYAPNSDDFSLTAPLNGVNNELNALQLGDYAALYSYAGSRKAVYVTGYMGSTSPSGIAGMMIYDPSDSSTAPNGGTVFGSIKGGRWKRVYQGEMEVDWFGAFGALDSKAAITAAIGAAQNTPGGAILGFRAGATYKMLSGITWNSTLVGFQGRGATLDCTSFTNQILLQPTQSGLDVNERTGAAWLHSVEDLRFRGPNFTQTATCLLVDAPADNLVNAGLLMKRCVFQGWASDIVQRAGAFFCTYEFCNFQGVIGAGSDGVYSIRIEPGSNSGERTIFNFCLFGGRNYIFTQTNPNADTFFNTPSFDYPGRVVALVTAGSVSVNGGHTEGNSDVANWFQVSGADSVLNISPSHTLTISGPKSAFSPFYCDSTTTNGGVFIAAMNIVTGPNAITVPLCQGTGRTKIRDCTYGVGSYRFLTSAFQNKLTYPSFEDPNYTVDWTVGGTVPPVRTNEVTAQSGTYSLKFAPPISDSAVPTAYASVVCQPGDFGVVEFYYLTVNFATTGATLFATNYYVDKAGNQIGSNQQLLATTATVGAWTKVTAGMPQAAPAGAHGYRVFFSVFGTSSGAPKAYIDSVSITIG